MGGLALGSALAGRYAGSVTRPVLVYGILEAGIALSALAVPVLLAIERPTRGIICGTDENVVAEVPDVPKV